VESTTTVVDVSFLNSLYSIPSNTGDSSLSQSVFETSHEYYSASDLKAFQKNYGLPVKAATDTNGYETNDCASHGPYYYDHYYAYSTNLGPKDCDEGNLDIQYISGLAQATTSIYWYVAGNASDPYTDWITDIVDATDPPQSNSMSWGSDEGFMSASLMNAFNTEAMKLTSLGVTIMVSSGDDGVAGDYCNYCNKKYAYTFTNCPCLANSGSAKSSWKGSNSWTGTGYWPSYPATSPYVTAVGATMGPETGGAEIACQSQKGGVITSGGGFSSYYAQPSWQTTAVNTYFSTITSTPAAGYNAMGRGYPDVSMIGVWYQVMIQDALTSLFGTSASSPVFAAMITLVNTQRKQNGLSAVGFINPTLYATTTTGFNDITSGSNKCCAYGGTPASGATCCTSGFTAAKGWDPVTGWGSVDYTPLYDMFTTTTTSKPSKKPTAAPTKTTKKPTQKPAAKPSVKPTKAPVVPPL